MSVSVLSCHAKYVEVKRMVNEPFCEVDRVSVQGDLIAYCQVT